MPPIQVLLDKEDYEKVFLLLPQSSFLQCVLKRVLAINSGGILLGWHVLVLDLGNCNFVCFGRENSIGISCSKNPGTQFLVCTGTVSNTAIVRSKVRLIIRFIIATHNCLLDTPSLTVSTEFDPSGCGTLSQRDLADNCKRGWDWSSNS